MQFRVVDADSSAPGPKTGGETLNISSSGLCLAAPDRLRPDSQLALELSLIEREDPVMAMGRVVWCDPDGDVFRVGICFTWVRDEDVGELARVADFIEARLESS